jgi:hypothetical protein
MTITELIGGWFYEPEIVLQGVKISFTDKSILFKFNNKDKRDKTSTAYKLMWYMEAEGFVERSLMPNNVKIKIK